MPIQHVFSAQPTNLLLSFLLFLGTISRIATGFVPWVPVTSSPHAARSCKETYRLRQRILLTVATSADQSQGELMTEESSFEQVDEDEELVLNFVEMVQNTPSGELDVDDIDLLREIMGQLAVGTKRKIDGVETAQIVETLLSRLICEWEAWLDAEDAEKDKYCRPTSVDFEVAIGAWASSGNPDKVVHVLSILSDQRELYLMTEKDAMRPTLASIKLIMASLAESRERGLDKRAAQVYDSLEELSLTPDAEIYGQMVSIIAKSRGQRASERAEEMLREGVKKFPPGLVDGKGTGIPVEAFNSVVVSYAKGGREDGPQRAQELIAFMEQVDSDLGICSPNINTFTALIDAYCQQCEWESVSQADRILNRLLDLYLEGRKDLEPNVATWTIVINAWRMLSKKNRRGAADRAGRLLRRMEELHRDGRITAGPDAITYVTCLNAYASARGGEDAGEAEKVLEEMHELYLDGDSSMKPSPRSVHNVVDAWIRSGDMDSAESFLDDFEEFLYEDDNEEFSEHTIEMYRSMLYGHTKQGNMDRARYYLDFMIEKGMKPDNLCFDSLIEGYTRLNTKTSLQNSLQVFEILEKCRRSGDIKPNERVYTSFIRAITKGQAADVHKKAETLLKRMKSFYEGGNDGIRPTVFSYNAVINACAESVKVEGNARDEAFKTAVRVFTELRNGKESLDHVTFGNMLRCAQLLPEGGHRDKYVAATFKLCCEQGCVNEFVLRDLQLATSEEHWRGLLDQPVGEPTLAQLPSSWSYKVNRENQKGGRFNGRGRNSKNGGNGGGRRYRK